MIPLHIHDNIPAMSDKAIAIAVEAEEHISKLEQIKLTTIHTLHGGIYSRTITLHKGEALVGALIKIPTTLMISGQLRLFIGEEVHEVDGVEVLAASANRKQVMVAIEDTYLTMYFATKATTIEEAEDEFTDDSFKLMSRQDEAINIINITGE